MKNLTTLVFLGIITASTSCGLKTELREDCGDDIKMLCNAFLGYKDKEHVDHTSRLDEIERRLDDTESNDLDRTEIVEICPSPSQEFPEVLLKIDGQYMALLTDRVVNLGQFENMDRFVVLPEDTNFMTTDGYGTLFHINDGALVCGRK